MITDVATLVEVDSVLSANLGASSDARGATILHSTDVAPRVVEASPTS